MNNIISTKKLIMLSMLLAIIIITLVVTKNTIESQTVYVKEFNVPHNVYKLESNTINTHVDKPELATNNYDRNRILKKYKTSINNLVVNDFDPKDNLKYNHYIYIPSLEGELNYISKVTGYLIYNKEINISLELDCYQVYSPVYDYLYEVEVPNFIDNSYKIKVDKISKEDISICDIK